MEKILNPSTIQHLLGIFVYVLVIIYTSSKRREIRRNARRSIGEFILINTILIVLVFINLIRLASEFFGSGDPQIGISLDIISHYANVIAMAGIIMLLISNKIVIKPSCRPQRILAIGAHPDDIEIAAGATLAKQRDSGNYVFGLILTQGTQGGDATRRLLEAKKGAEFLGLDEYKILDFHDTRMSDQSNEVLQAIETVINQIKPDMIFTHSVNDIHQDHQVVHNATLRAARRSPTILCYESPSATADFRPEYFVDVANYVDVKVEAIRGHWDQRKKPYVKPDKVRSKLAFRGEQARIDFAEGFEVIRMVSTD
jgi:LmbE family N-acetylglucosaminyl deacetylase